MKQQIKNGIIFGLTTGIVFTLFGVVYAAWNDTVSNGDTVSASSWNTLVEKVSDIDNAINSSNPSQVVLESGYKEGTTTTLTETFTTTTDGVLHLSGYAHGSYYPSVNIKVDGVFCSTDMSYNSTGTNQYVSASCIRDLSAGTHTIQSVFAGSPLNSHKMSWSVITKSISGVGGSGVSDGFTGGFGNWEIKSLGTTYQADTDGFVIATIQGTSSWGHIVGYSDSSSSPSTKRGYAGQDWQRTGNNHNSFMMPVKSSDYWRVSVGYGPNGNVEVQWIPLQ